MKHFKKHSPTAAPLLLILAGSLSWILTMVKSGLPTQWGIGFWGANGHDGIWHLALANSLARGSLDMPVFAGSPLENYHIGFDLLLALLSKTGISVSIWYFQILPVLLSVAVGVLTFTFIKNWTKNTTAGLWSVFFVYFAGSFGWIVTLLREGSFGGESLFWSQQSVSTLINPPFALSLVLLLGALVLLQKYLVRPKPGLLLQTSLLFGLLIAVKAYIGVLALTALAVCVVGSFFITRSLTQTRSIITLLFCAAAVSAIVFLPLNKASSGLLVFQPFWFLETMLAISDRFHWMKLYEAIINWRAAHNYPKAIAGYTVAFVLFFFGNLGLRVFALANAKLFFKRDIISVFLTAVAFLGLIACMLFVQQGTAWNTIQFFYYSLFVMSLFAGIAMAQVLAKVKGERVRTLLSIIVIVLTLPTTISTLISVYLPGRPPAVLPQAEYEALTFLKTQPNGVTLTFPFDPLLAKEAIANPPRPLYLYDSTAYVSAYANKPVLLEDEVNLTIMGYKWKERRAEIEAFYKLNNGDETQIFFKKHNISYIYWVKPQQRAVLGDLQLKLTNIFENKEVVIYRTSF